MLFNSLEFVVFFPLVLLLYYALGKWLRVQNVFLLLASYVFYSFWDWRFLSLVILSSLVDYYCGVSISKSESVKAKRFVILSVAFNLGILAVFKYLDFFIHEFSSLLAALGFQPNIQSLNLILPLGISFYTFQTMAYTIDVYRGKVKAENDFINLALYVSFFPQLVAGPIERAQHLLPQIKNKRILDTNDFLQGGWLIFFGYFLKVFLADNLAPIVNSCFSVSDAGFYDTMIGVLAFTFQIYGDFAGYTFIAIGIARWLGFDLMTNFLFPYFVGSPQAFWKNWHISLSSWLRDYLYIPLGGNRGSRIFTYRNLMITMLLGGLWHGASWNFVLWGFYHGLILIIYRMAGWDKEARNTIIRYFKIAIMFVLTCLGWLMFRVENMHQLQEMFLSIFDYAEPQLQHIDNIKLLLFFVTLPLLVKILQYKTKAGNRFDTIPIPLRVAVYTLMFYAIFAYGEFGKQEFIYFQF